MAAKSPMKITQKNKYLTFHMVHQRKPWGLPALKPTAVPKPAARITPNFLKFPPKLRLTTF